MDPYEDSFETATSATDEEAEEAMSSQSSSSSADNHGSSNDDADVPPPRSEGRRHAAALPLPPAPSVRPQPTGPGLPIPIVAAPTPASLAVQAPMTGTNASSKVVTVLALSNTLPAATPGEQSGAAELITNTAARTPNTQARSGSDSAAAISMPTQEASTAPQNNSVATTSEGSGSARPGPGGMNFEALSHFVAFGGSGSGSDGTTGQASQWPSAVAAAPNSGGSLSVRKFSAASAEQSREVTVPQEAVTSAEPAAEGTPLLAAAPSPPPAMSPPQKASSSSTSKAASAAPSSSVFSTLSQHLQQQQRPVPFPLPTPTPVAAVSPLSAERLTALPTAQTPAAAASRPSLPLPRVQVPSTPLPVSSLMATTEAATVTAAVPPSPLRASIPLPALPLPAWAAPPALTTTTDTTTADPAQPSQLHGWMIGESSYPVARHTEPSGDDAAAAAAPWRAASAPHMPPPLPPPREAPPSELREATEAVERLVRSFAVLKGYGSLERAQQRGAPSPVEAAAVAVSRADTCTAPASLHRAGATATVQVRDATRRRGPRVFASAERVTAPTEGAGGVGGSAPPLRREAQERLAEGLVLDCVLGLLHERTQGPNASAAAASSWRTARPHYEVVSADDFAYTVGGRSRAARAAAAGGGGSGTSAQVYANASSIFCGGLLGSSGAPLFDPRDRQSAVDLYNAVREALEKYVLRRVLRADKRGAAGEATAVPPPERTAPITATFAWTLLLDVVSLCEEIARVAYDSVSCAPSAVYPVLAQFHGDAACEEVVRTTMHCLPFEALNTDSGSTRGGGAAAGACLFRMACWVTQQQLWTIADAASDTVRDDMVKRARAQQYVPFSGAPDREVDPRLIVPPSTPLLTLRPLPGRHATAVGNEAAPPQAEDGATAAAASYARVRDGATVRQVPRGSAAGSSFDVPAAALEKVAYHVSRLSTDLLEDTSGGTAGPVAALTTEEYPDVAAAVAETLGELLEDESIKAAVRRRASDKVTAALRARANNATATRQRREQAIIDKAEREAQEVVQRILQEMHVQGVA